jgi:hypothetical protein
VVCKRNRIFKDIKETVFVRVGNFLKLLIPVERIKKTAEETQTML